MRKVGDNMVKRGERGKDESERQRERNSQVKEGDKGSAEEAVIKSGGRKEAVSIGGRDNGR